MLFGFPNTRVACLVIASALLSGCHAKRTRNSPEPSPLTPIAQDIQRRGYRANESLVVPPTPWEVSTFRMRSRRFFSFRAEQPLPNEREKYYCRFSLTEETYDSVDDARQRLANLHRVFPDGPREDEYMLTMRTGFHVGTIVYVLQTDAAIFWGEVQRLNKSLASSTNGAELTRAIENRRTLRWTGARGARFAT